MKVLTYTSCKEHCDLHTKIQGSIAVNSCQVGHAQKDFILLSKTSLILYKASELTSVTNTEFIKFTLSEGTQLMNLMQKSRYKSHNKERIEKRLKLKT